MFGACLVSSDKGQIDFDAVLSALDSAGYEGVLCIEYMKTPGWHGMMEVDAIEESVRLRDALRDARGLTEVQ